MRYWLKELPEENCYLPTGQKVVLDFVGVNGDGFISSENGFVNAQLAKAVQSHIGGWVEIDQIRYDEELKKKAQHPASVSRRKSPAWRAYRNNLPDAARAAEGRSVEAVAFVPAPKPEPLKVPTPEQLRPRTAKASQLRVSA